MEEQVVNQSQNINFENKVKKINRRSSIYLFLRVGIVCIIFLLIAIYILTPLSTISNMSLNGNVFLTNDDIYSIMNKSESTSLYNIDENEAEELLNNHPLIDDAKVKVKPFSITVNIKEKAPSVMYDNDLYDVDGNKFEPEYYSNELTKTYLELNKGKCPKSINDLSSVDSGYLRNYFYFIPRVNKEEMLIKYVENVENKKSFIFYYKVNSNSNYLRVKLKYEDKFSNDDYLENLSNDVISQAYTLISKSSDYSVEEKVIYEEKVNYYATSLSLISKNNKVEAKFEKDV